MGFEQIAVLLAVLIVWFVLARWVLPWLGVPTCMSGSCSARPSSQEKEAGPDASDSDER